LERILINIRTAFGNIQIKLFPEQAPLSVANFMKYVDHGLFNGSSFFRILDNNNQPDSDYKIDVIQGGLKNDDSRLFDPVEHEATAKTGLLHKDGTISLARWGGAGSAQGSFFICVGDQPELDYGGRRNPDGQGFAAFGQVFAGMDVVRQIWSKAEREDFLRSEIMIHEISHGL
jgi:peptidyl-prolyl cis-trans isomerase A (cyclophilin A)